MKQKWTTQRETLAQAMKIESMYEYQEMAQGVAPTSSFVKTPEMEKVQSQLAVLAEQLWEQNLAKMKREQVWCMVCKMEGHTTNEYPSLRVGVGAPNPTL